MSEDKIAEAVNRVAAALSWANSWLFVLWQLSPLGGLMDYDTMPAGPEMDRLVAERVMPGVSIEPMNGQSYLPWRYPSSLHCFRPSTDIAHAWEVVERLNEGFKGKRVFYLQTDSYGFRWMASWHRPEEYVTMAEYEADTAPLAICRAALKAVIPKETP